MSDPKAHATGDRALGQGNGSPEPDAGTRAQKRSAREPIDGALGSGNRTPEPEAPAGAQSRGALGPKDSAPESGKLARATGNETLGPGNSARGPKDSAPETGNSALPTTKPRSRARRRIPRHRERRRYHGHGGHGTGSGAHNSGAPASGKRAAVFLFLVLLAVFILLPLGFLVVSAFAGPWRFPALLPQDWSFRGLEFAAREASGILRSLAVSFGYSVGTVVLTLLMSWLPAKFLARHRFRGQHLVDAMLLAPALVPAITFALGLQHLFIRLGIVDSVLGVMLALAVTSYPYMLRALKIGFLAFDSRYEEAARNLGGTRVQNLVRVELPVLLPALGSGASLVFLVAFTEYFLVYLIGGGVVQGFSGYLIPFIRASDRAASSILSLIFVALPLLLFLLLEVATRASVRRLHGDRAFRQP